MCLIYPFTPDCGGQPLMVISPTASWIRRCMQVYVWWFNVDLFVWAERSTPDNFLGSSHRFNSATGEQKGIIQTIYTDSKPPSWMPNSLMPSAKLRSANLPFLRLFFIYFFFIQRHFSNFTCDAVGDRTPASRTPSGRSNHCATRGRGHDVGMQLR